MAPAEHTPVLLQEVLEHLAIGVSGRFIDCTFGRGGHSREILKRMGPEGRLLVIDRDPEAVAAARELAQSDHRVAVEHGSFGDLLRLCGQGGMDRGIDGILFDLGASSPQLQDPERGFSFSLDGPLDMRMDPGSGEDAQHWLAQAPEQAIAQVLRDYGEERYARRIARAIVAARRRSPIARTGELAELVARAKPRRERSIHPATRTFQAIRIYINDELQALYRALPQAVDLLRAGGRLLVISFHSLEDRIVKRFLRDASRVEHGLRVPGLVPEPYGAQSATLRRLGRAIRPTPDEIAGNPRARSAILRVAERLA